MDETDAAILILNERSTDSITSWTAPQSYSVSDDVEDILEGATQRNTVANDDLLITQIEASGIYGYMLDDQGNLSNESGLELTYTDTEEPPYGSAPSVSVNELVDSNNAKIVPVPEEDTFYVVADITNHAEIEADETWNAQFSVTEDNPYIEDEDSEESLDENIDIEERNIEFASELNDDDQLPIENSENSEVTVESNVAPGTEVDYRLRFATSVFDGEATVGDDGTATASWDFSDREAGEELDFVRATEAGDAEVEAAGIIVSAEPEPEADISVEGEVSPSEVQVGDDATLDVTVTNDGDAAGTVDFHIDIDGETVVQEEITVEAGGTHEVSEDFDTSSAGDISWETDAGNATDEGTLTVSEESTDDSGSDDSGSDDSGSDDSGSDGDDSDDGTPGFGVGVALVALLGAAMLALRRQN